MFRLALQDGRLRGAPYFAMLKERNVRKGFLDHDQYVLLRDAVPDYLKPVLAMGYFTGMRRGEIRSLRWAQVSFADNQVRLDPGTTKNDEPRVIPLAGELRAILEMQLCPRNLECPDCPFVIFRQGKKFGFFLRRGGAPAFESAWANFFVRTAPAQQRKKKTARMFEAGDAKEVKLCGYDFSRSPANWSPQPGPGWCP